MTFGPSNLKAPEILTGYAAVIAENLRLLASRRGSAEALLTATLALGVVVMSLLLGFALAAAHGAGVSLGSLLY